MRRIRNALAPWLLLLQGQAGAAPLDYDQAIHLDAEDLAEGGVVRAYEQLGPQLRRYVARPMAATERHEPNPLRYIVNAGGVEYVISDAATGESESWGRATHALFDIVNRQLAGSEVGFHAINGGNDLHGMFLTERQAKDARRRLRRTDWPYLPQSQPPWFGRPH